MKKVKNSCVVGDVQKGADNSSELARVNRIRGQIEGVGKMISERAYCPDIITQIQAIRAALGSLQGAILSSHLQNCVKKGFKKGDAKESEKLLEELLSIFKHY